MKTEIPDILASQIRDHYGSVRGRAEKRAVLLAAADHFGVSYSTICRKLSLRARKRSLSSKQQSSIDTKNAYGRIVFDFIKERSAEERDLSMKKAYSYLSTMGHIPASFTLKDCYDAIERMKLKNGERAKTMRFKRWERRHAHELIQVDFTKSEYLQCVGNEFRMTNGRWSRGKEKNFLWIGVAVDDATRVHYAEYIPTPGESAIVAQQFIIRAMEKKPGAMLYQGKPGEVYFDRGGGFKTVTQDGLKALGMKVIVGCDHEGTKTTNKQARGKVEAVNKFIIGDFEEELRMKFSVGHRFSLGDLNELLREWSEWQNQQAHPTRRVDSKWNYFKGALADCEYADRTSNAVFALRKVTTVRRRMIHTGKGDYWQIPDRINEGVEVQYILRQGACFVEWEGEEIKLQAQSSHLMDNMPKARVEIEVESDTFDDAMLRDRFNRELQVVTNGELSLRLLSRDDLSDLKVFFERPRTLEEIRIEAENLKMRVLLPKTLTTATNIIQYDPSLYR